MSPWIAHAKGGPASSSFEIAVVRENNTHGIASYGWFDERKLLVSHNGGPCRWGVTKPVWDKLIALAEYEAARLNALEE